MPMRDAGAWSRTNFDRGAPRPIDRDRPHSHYSPLFNIALEIDVPAYLSAEVEGKNMQMISGAA